MKNELAQQFLDLINDRDPSHGLLFRGIISASEWLAKIDQKERSIVYRYMEEIFAVPGDTPLKEQIIKVLQLTGGEDSMLLLDKILSDGEIFHGKYLVDDAIHAKNKLLESP